jgi:cytochrome c biogenesis protein CcmG, thiol:disulfide interchange protein DsbE
MRHPVFIIVAIALTVANEASVATQSAQQAKIGNPAPTFSLGDLSGRTLDLANYRGKVVLLDFWATWCETCREEIPYFVALQRKYGDRGLVIVGISMDEGQVPVQKFCEELKMNYPVAMGDAKLAEGYGGILGLPVAFLIDRDGRIRRRLDGRTDAAVLENEIVALLRKGQ